MADARATADRYVEVAKADGKDALATLFAVDGVFHAPDGVIYKGRDQIAAFYKRHLANVVPAFHIHRAAHNGSDCWIELADGPTDQPTLLASNHFTVGDDGLITRLAVFLRPRSSTS
jgi:SnoaL-like domain